MPLAGSAYAQRSIRRSWAQGRVALSRGADCLLKSNPEFLPVWKTVLSLPQFLYRYGIIDEEKPTHAGRSQRWLMLPAAARAWPFNHTECIECSPSDERALVSHEKKSPTLPEALKAVKVPGIYSEILFGAITKVKCIHVYESFSN